MFIKILLNFLCGYVNIKVEGFFIERFINICISKKILLWGIRREKSTILFTNISIKDYKKIKKVVQKTKSKIKLENKKGLPFILHKYRKRKIFLGLLILISVGLVIMSNFVWNIEINGNSTIAKEELINELEQYGLKIGLSKAKIDVNSIINKIRLNRDDIAWIGIKLEGTNAIIEIKEAQKAPEIINENQYCNIVANKSGLITKINVQNGTAMVKQGDIVQEGDILIAGFLEGKYTGIRYVHSIGEIEAKVWYSKRKRSYYNQSILTETGNTEDKYSIDINNFKINFYKTLSKFEKYDTIYTYKKIKLFSNFYLPIHIRKQTNIEQVNQNVAFTEQELIDVSTKNLEEDLHYNISNKDNIINKQVNYYKNQDYIEVEVIYEVLENIGIKEKIAF